MEERMITTNLRSSNLDDFVVLFQSVHCERWILHRRDIITANVMTK